jgi:biopolymer transport protein ExbD
MAFGSFKARQESGPMSDINVTPMVDIMLVLLIIFIISAPLFTHALQLDLPNAPSGQVEETAKHVKIAIDAQGQFYWQDQAVTKEALIEHMKQAAQSEPQPELQLSADKSTRYEIIADIMSAAQEHGLSKLGFVTDPKPATQK